MELESIQPTYDELAAMLRALGLNWVLSQVEETITAGLVIQKATNIFTDQEAQEGHLFDLEETLAPRRRGKAAQMTSVQPWPNALRLRFLIDAIRHAIVYAAEIENATFELLQGFATIEAIHFYVDDERTKPTPFVLVREQRASIERLRLLLNALESEVP